MVQKAINKRELTSWAGTSKVALSATSEEMTMSKTLLKALTAATAVLVLLPGVVQAQVGSVFGVTLGAPMSLPPCMTVNADGSTTTEKAGPCYGVIEPQNIDASRGDWVIAFQAGATPDWVEYVYASKAPSGAVGLVSIYTTRDGFGHQQTVDALVKKYGKPADIAKVTSTNRLGARVETQVMSWKNNAVSVMYVQAGPRDEFGRVRVLSREMDEKEQAERRAKSARKAEM